MTSTDAARGFLLTCVLLPWTIEQYDAPVDTALGMRASTDAPPRFRSV
ncbi:MULTISPECIES: hypothetical protein [unclassified Streptomyces]